MAESVAYTTPAMARSSTLRSSVVQQRLTFDPFKGSNGPQEIEDLSEFREASSSNLTSWDGFVFQEVDFSSLDAESLLGLNLKGASFLGCRLPVGLSEETLRSKGATVLENPSGIPFRAYRAFLYSQEELQRIDEATYSFYLSQNSILDNMYMSNHDFSIQDALLDYAEGKCFVSVMGGHAVQRGDQSYADCLELGAKLARNGFIVTTGGGPGAMEAANCGAYLFKRDEAAFARALDILRRPSDVTPQYKDVATAQAVIDELGPLNCTIPSLGIPTWKYGHEPSNRFCGEWVGGWVWWCVSLLTFNPSSTSEILQQCPPGRDAFAPLLWRIGYHTWGAWYTSGNLYSRL